ncbi:hypothetical protein PhCBS80983_g02423 [Powellomyces hirtus]|uniref:Biogenesis of lysosome-related organelles complex 1 subunit 7 n=1 Tax=Powellomyces hirtus TaxID=109895 RepID=A0A507E6S3_9FUNG|nr:hypothetical protein PhCBS80983_g02423 [Powellomyces hirtus]
MSTPESSNLPLLAPHLLPLLHHLDIQTLQLRHAHRDLYDQIEHLTAELQLLLSNTPPADTHTLAGAVTRLTLLRKRLTRMDGMMKTLKERIGRVEHVAIRLATWSSSKFAVAVTELVEKFMTARVKTEHSQRAAMGLNDKINRDALELEEVPQIAWQPSNEELEEHRPLLAPLPFSRSRC